MQVSCNRREAAAVEVTADCGRIRGNPDSLAITADDTQTQVRRDAQLPFAADLHSCDAVVPALNHLSPSQLELKGALADGSVKLFATGQPACVIYCHFLSGDGGCSGAGRDVPVLHARACCFWLAGNFGWARGLRGNRQRSQNEHDSGEDEFWFHMSSLMRA